MTQCHIYIDMYQDVVAKTSERSCYGALRTTKCFLVFTKYVLHF